MESFLSSRRLLAALVAVLLILSFIPTSGGPALEVLLSGAGLGQINESAQKHLEAQREQALKGFLLLSALKVGVAVLRSSEVGIIFNVKIGDLAVAVYDYVNFGWKVLVAAVAYYYAAEFLLDLTSVVDIWFLWSTLVCLAAWLLAVELSPESRKLRAILVRSGTSSAVLAALLYIALPLSFVGAGWVSTHITGGPILEANALYEDMKESMPSLVEERAGEEKGLGASGIETSSVTVPFPYDGSDPALAVKEESGERKDQTGVLASLVSGEKVKVLKEYLQQRSRTLATAVLRQTAAYLFNIVFFPMLMLVVLYLGFRYLTGLAAIRS